MSEHEPDPLIEIARLAGCDCDPTFQTTELAPGIYETRIAHDHHCRLLNRLDRGSN